MTHEIFSSSILTLIDYFYPVIRFEANPGFPGWTPEEAVEPTAHVNVKVRPMDEMPNAWWVQLDISVDWPERPLPPYKVAELRSIGLFKFPDDTPSERIDEQLTVSAPSILYSGARDFVKSLTSRGPYPPVLMPTITFRPGRMARPQDNEKANPPSPAKARTGTSKTPK